jgi:hypothetical protein
LDGLSQQGDCNNRNIDLSHEQQNQILNQQNLEQVQLQQQQQQQQQYAMSKNTIVNNYDGNDNNNNNSNNNIGIDDNIGGGNTMNSKITNADNNNDPTTPGTACNEKHSRQSSMPFFSTAYYPTMYEKKLATMPIIKAPYGYTNPDPGVTAAKPANTPFKKSVNLNFYDFCQKYPINNLVIPPVQLAICVLTSALADCQFAAKAEPALKLYQPAHINIQPIVVNIKL